MISYWASGKIAFAMLEKWTRAWSWRRQTFGEVISTFFPAKIWVTKKKKKKSPLIISRYHSHLALQEVESHEYLPQSVGLSWLVCLWWYHLASIVLSACCLQGHTKKAMFHFCSLFFFQEMLQDFDIVIENSVSVCSWSVHYSLDMHWAAGLPKCNKFSVAVV